MLLHQRLRLECQQTLLQIRYLQCFKFKSKLRVKEIRIKSKEASRLKEVLLLIQNTKSQSSCQVWEESTETPSGNISSTLDTQMASQTRSTSFDIVTLSSREWERASMI